MVIEIWTRSNVWRLKFDHIVDWINIRWQFGQGMCPTCDRTFPILITY